MSKVYFISLLPMVGGWGPFLVDLPFGAGNPPIRIKVRKIPICTLIAPYRYPNFPVIT